MEMTSRYFRTAAAAKYCGIAKSTLEKMRCSGDGPAFSRRGRTILYDRSSLDVWLDSLPRYRSTSEADAGKAAALIVCIVLVVTALTLIWAPPLHAMTVTLNL